MFFSFISRHPPPGRGNSWKAPSTRDRPACFVLARAYGVETTMPNRIQEKEMIEAALRESQGRVCGPSGAAAKLGIAHSTLESKIRSLKINKNHFKNFAATLSRRFCLESVL